MNNKMSEAEILKIVKNDKSLLFATEIINLLRQKNSPDKKCPFCKYKYDNKGDNNFRKAGMRGNKQLYYCKKCERVFALDKDDDSHYEYVRKRLKQMRKYNEVGFILITNENKFKLAKKYPKIKVRLDSGMLRRDCYVYHHLI